MQNIPIHSQKASLHLLFVDAFHPSQVPIKADHWYLRYQLALPDNSFKFDDWFTGNFWYLNGGDSIVFEVYANESFTNEAIKHDDDVKLKLLLIDFKKNAMAHFSGMHGGSFEVTELTKDERIIYRKKQHGKTGEYEVALNALKFEPIYT